jgi:hypothetical protein
LALLAFSNSNVKPDQTVWASAGPVSERTEVTAMQQEKAKIARVGAMATSPDDKAMKCKPNFRGASATLNLAQQMKRRSCGKYR